MLTIQRWLISGRVQGVGYRAWLVSEARARRVAGWVRNLGDGRVEAVVQGEASNLATLLERANCGPAAAHVVHVDVEARSIGVSPGVFTTQATSPAPLEH